MLTQPEDLNESATWTIATTIMIVTSLIVIIIQRMIFQVFDYVFEICIFYVPTLIITIIYITQKIRQTRVQPPA
ncbi:MAG: hypothetical protein NWE83_12960 [Candidatus Bathyarchaeota archaeon]|nr:hypothetical protein [Candidatus Bathyarchaeota archaeon]